MAAGCHNINPPPPPTGNKRPAPLYKGYFKRGGGTLKWMMAHPLKVGWRWGCQASFQGTYRSPSPWYKLAFLALAPLFFLGFIPSALFQLWNTKHCCVLFPISTAFHSDFRTLILPRPSPSPYYPKSETESCAGASRPPRVVYNPVAPEWILHLYYTQKLYANNMKFD